MSTLAEIGYYLVTTLGSLYLGVIMLRFFLQVARADFYNPASQFIVKATNPLLIPLRRVIPGVFGIDLASLVLALAINIAITYLRALLLGYYLPSVLQALTWGLISILSLAVFILFWTMLIMVIASWIAPMSHNPLLMLIRQLVEPFVAPFRRLIPPMGGLDFSVLFAFIALNVILIVLGNMAEAAGFNARAAIFFRPW